MTAFESGSPNYFPQGSSNTCACGQIFADDAAIFCQKCGMRRGKVEYGVRSQFQESDPKKNVAKQARLSDGSASFQTSPSVIMVGQQRMDGVLPGHSCAGQAVSQTAVLCNDDLQKSSSSGVAPRHDAFGDTRPDPCPSRSVNSHGFQANGSANQRNLMMVKNLMNEEGGTCADPEGADDVDYSDTSVGMYGGMMRAKTDKSFACRDTAQDPLRTAGVAFAQSLRPARNQHINKINVILEDDDHSFHKRRLILTPNGKIARTWQKLTALAVIYIVGVVSFDMGFNWWKISQSLYVWGHIVDMWFWADMIVTFRTGYIHGGHLVMDWRRIARHYLHFWFWVDLTANVPWERLMMVSKSNRKAIKFLKWLKLPRLLRLGRLRKLMKANARYLNLVILLSSFFLCIHIGACAMVWFSDPCSAYVEEDPFSEWYYSHEVEERLVARHPRLGWECMQNNIKNVYAKAMHEATAMLLGVDKGSLMSYISGGGESTSLLEEVRNYAVDLLDTKESAARDPTAARMRAVKLALLQRRYPLSLADSHQFGGASCFPASHTNLNNTDSCISRYFSGFNTQADMNTFGLSFHVPLDVFGALMLMCGLYLQGLLFANLTRLLIARHHSETVFRQKHDEVKRELELYGPLIPESVQKRIEKTFEFRWVNQAYGPLQLLKPDHLSLSLRGELALYLYKTAVTKVEFLQDAPLNILTKVCLNLEPQDYMLRDTIYRRGEYPSGIYLVDKGKVLLTVSDKAGVHEEFLRNSTQTNMGRTVSMGVSSISQEVGSGEHFGTGAAIAAIQVHAEQDHVHVSNKKSAIAATVCHLLCLSIKLFREICDAHPKFFWELKHLDEADQNKQGEEEGDKEKRSSTTSAKSNGHGDSQVQEYPSPFRRSFMRQAGDPEMAERIKRLHQEVQSHGDKLDQIVDNLETLVLRVRSQSDKAVHTSEDSKRSDTKHKETERLKHHKTCNV